MSQPEQTGIIAWFAHNRVAANLMMMAIIIAGLFSSCSIRKQTTPDFELNTVSIRVPYLGAAPQEVEEGIVIKIEEAIQDVLGITEIRATAGEGSGNVTAKISRDADLNQVMSDIKTRVDAIDTFPELAEKPVIYKNEIPFPVVFLAIYGDLDEYGRKEQAQKLRKALMALPEVNQVENLGDRDYEISIEVSEHTLRQYGLTMADVSDAVRASSVDLPGGTIKSEGGDILLRTEGQVYRGIDFAAIVLRTLPDGTRLTVGDIATIDDGFVESDGFGRFDGVDSATLRVLANGQQNELRTAAVVKDFIKEYGKDVPDGVTIDVWVDRAHYLQDRLDMMLKNMFQGAVLVFFVLTLFLRLKVALWVIVGIPVTFLGALALMPLGPWPVTINVISLFAFILVLGIVVDDAIIIGESVYTKIRADGHSVENVVAGAHRVATAATFGVLTTIAAFVPMLFIGGDFAPFLEAQAVVVSLCLIFSLIESKLILPAHLAHAKIAPVDEQAIFAPYRGGLGSHIGKFFQRFQRRFQHGLQRIIQNWYQPTLRVAIRHRGVTIAIFVSAFIVTIGVLLSGLTRVVLFPTVPGDYIQASMQMEAGTPPAVRNTALLRVEQALVDAMDDYQAAHPEAIRPVKHIATFTQDSTTGAIVVELPIDESRPLNVFEITDLWREATPEIAGVKSILFNDGSNLGGGKPIALAISGSHYPSLEAASDMLASRLEEYEGVYDIETTATGAGDEIQLSVKPAAETLGITMTTLGRQVRQAFYGEEAQRIQRGTDELKVMVRYPEAERRSVASLRDMRIRTPNGAAVPFDEVAEVEFGNAFTEIQRLDRERTVIVDANLDTSVAQSGPILGALMQDVVPEMSANYPLAKVALQGSSQEEIELMQSFSIAAVAALFLIYALIAIPLKSYLQPLIIMSVIPYGLIGAVIGHLVFGHAISMFSIFGLIALAGVVVNDSLIMMDFINKARLKGVPVVDAVMQSGQARFRAIILTSLTTSFGLMPIIFETSVQAQFVIPMAISLSFGILFATVITLFLIPCLYLLLEDIKRFFRRLFKGAERGVKTPAVDVSIDATLR